MKVLILSSHAQSIFFHRENMISDMQKKGHEIIVAAPEKKSNYAAKFEDINIEYEEIKFLNKTGTNPLKDFLALFSLFNIIKKIKPDRIFTYQAKTNIYGSIAARFAGIKDIYIFMGGLGSVIRNENPTIVQKILKTQYKLSFYIAKKIFVQNQDDLNLLVNNNLIKKGKVTMVNGSGVNLDYFKKRKIVNKNTFLLIARIIRDKGIMEYIEAAKIVKDKYPETEIQLLGYFDTNPTAIKKKTIKKYEDENIINYLGTTDDVRPYLNETFVFVLPSYHEGTPKSVLEAMAVGRPIITTDAPGCRETVIDGKNGLLVPVKNHKILADKMIWMLENKEQAVKMGDMSRKICEEKFDVNKVNENILKVMEL
jgi:glycosyltransferase involved in cell wall biosynthesis